MTRVTGFGELLSKVFEWDPRLSFVTESVWPAWGVPSLPTCVPVLILSESIDSGAGFISDDRSDGVRRALVGGVRPGPELIARDGASIANTGRPSASLPVSRSLPWVNRSTQGVRRFLPAEISLLGLSRSGLGRRGVICVRWRFGFCARRVVVVDRAVVVGHVPVTSHLIRSCFIMLGMSRRLGGIPSALNGKEREILTPPFCLPQLARPSLTVIPFLLSRSGERFLFRSFACSSSSVAL